MWKCRECGHEQTGSCYCQACNEEGTMEPSKTSVIVPKYGDPVYYRNGELEMEFLSLGELDERHWLKVATEQDPHEYWGSLHRWETE